MTVNSGAADIESNDIDWVGGHIDIVSSRPGLLFPSRHLKAIHLACDYVADIKGGGLSDECVLSFSKQHQVKSSEVSHRQFALDFPNGRCHQLTETTQLCSILSGLYRALLTTLAAPHCPRSRSTASDLLSVGSRAMM